MFFSFPQLISREKPPAFSLMKTKLIIREETTMKKFRILYAALGTKKISIALLLSFFVLSGTFARAQQTSRGLLNPAEWSQSDLYNFVEGVAQVGTKDINEAYDRKTNESNANLSGCKSFGGTWDGGSYGIMTLTQDGKRVSGTYEWKGTNYIRGTVRGRVLTGTYSQPTYPEDRYKKGNIKFTLAADGNSWSGTWTDKDGNNAGTWSGFCISN